MAKKSELPLVKRTLNLYEDDIQTLEKFFPSTGWSVAARKILHKSCKRLREQENATKTAINNNKILQEKLATMSEKEKEEAYSSPSIGPAFNDIFD